MRSENNDLIQAYSEVLLGVMILRHTDFQSLIKIKAKTVALKHSFPEGKNDSVVFNMEQTMRVVVNDGFYASKSLRMAMNLVHAAFITAMYERIPVEIRKKSKTGALPSPEIQFLHHLRNACAHNYKFKFDGKRLRQHASWRGKEMSPEMNGSSIFPEFLLDGDLVYSMILKKCI